MKYIELIKETFIGEHLSDDEISAALENRSFVIKNFEKRQYLHLEGEECHGLEVILVGEVIILKMDDYGNELIVNFLVNNAILAGNILFGTSPKYPLTVLSKSKGALLQINKNFLFELFIKKPQILRGFLTLISDRAIGLGHKMKLVRRLPLRAGIKEYLYNQSISQNSAIITLPISKAALANSLGVIRTSVSRELAKMEKEGLIKLRDTKTIEILKKL